MTDGAARTPRRIPFLQAAAEADNNDQKLSSAQEALLAKDNELEVDGWEFVSQHALAQEYLSSGK